MRTKAWVSMVVSAFAIGLLCSHVSLAAALPHPPLIQTEEPVITRVDQQPTPDVRIRGVFTLSPRLRTMSSDRPVRLLSYVVTFEEHGEVRTTSVGMPIVDAANSSVFDSQAGQPIVKRREKDPTQQKLPTSWKITARPAVGKTWADVSEPSHFEARVECSWD